MELGSDDVSLLERCPHSIGWYVQASMELGSDDVSLLERCPHFRGWYVQASMELGSDDVSLLERCLLPNHRLANFSKIWVWLQSRDIKIDGCRGSGWKGKQRMK